MLSHGFYYFCRFLPDFDLRTTLTFAAEVEEVYLPDENYRGENSIYAPDMIIGYRPPYRASWETPLGAVPAKTVVANKDAWVGDHCIAPKYVPGVLFSNKKSSISDPKLVDLTVTFLKEFGVEPSEGMIGRVLY